MIYPVGNGTKEDFIKHWYIPDGGEFGYDRGSYFHSGTDLNLKTGGDTDLGEKIRTIYKGKLEYYHRVSHPTYGFGRHNVYRIDGPWGTRWIGNCHCQEEDFLATKKELNEGDLVGRIGKSGTGYAHLHLKCFRVDPVSLQKGIDTVAKTKIQLDKWFEDPLAFIKRWYGKIEEENMDNSRQEIIDEYLAIRPMKFNEQGEWVTGEPSEDEIKARLEEKKNRVERMTDLLVGDGSVKKYWKEKWGVKETSGDIGLQTTITAYDGTFGDLKDVLRKEGIMPGDSNEKVVGKVGGLVEEVEELREKRTPKTIYKLEGKDYKAIKIIWNLYLLDLIIEK